MKWREPIHHQKTFEKNLGHKVDRARSFADACIWHSDPDPPPPAVFSGGWIRQKRMVMSVVLHSVPVQVVVSVLIIVDLALALFEEFHGWDSHEANLASTIVIILLSVEVLARLCIEGARFFSRKVNVIEGLAIWAGLIINVLGSSVPAATGRLLRPAARAVRGGRVLVKLWTRSTHIKRSANQVMAKKAEEIFWKFFADLVLIRPESMVFSPLTGKFDLAKACLNTQVFDEVHLPLTVNGGFLEALHCELPVAGIAGRAALNEGDAGTLLKVEIMNVVVIVSHGTVVDWTDHDVLKEQKARLVNRLVDKLVPHSLPDMEVADETGESPAVGVRNLLEISRMMKPIRRSIKQYSGMIESYIRREIHSNVFQGIDVDIRNIVIQFEEHEAIDLNRPQMLFGLKIGQLSASTRTCAATELEEADDLTELMQATLQQQQELMKHLVVTMERCSTYCTSRPQETACYTSHFKDGHIEAAVKRTKAKDLMERFRLALAGRKSQTGVSTTAALLSDRVHDLYQQYDYVLLPMKVTVSNTLPRFAQVGDKQDDLEMERVFDVRCSSVSVALDNNQAFVLNRWTDNILSWYRQDFLLQMRPEMRIETVLRMQDHARDWHSEYMRRTVVRQWWLHAFILVQKSIGSRSRNVACLVEVQVRSRCRLEYVELIAHLMRCRVHHGRSWRRKLHNVSAFLSCQKSGPHSEDADYADRLSSLQMRMSLYDVITSHFEARYVAGKREVDVARRRTGLFRCVMDYINDIGRRLQDEVPETYRITIFTTDSEYDYKVRYSDDSADQDSSIKNTQENFDLGFTVEECLPTNFRFTLPNAEFCFMLLSTWDHLCESVKGSIEGTVSNRGKLRPPRFHPMGTRHKLLHTWARRIDISLGQCKLVQVESDMFAFLMPRTIQASCGAVGARYFQVQTGKSTEALQTGTCEVDGKVKFLHVIGHRTDDDAPEHTWVMSVHIGHIRTFIDTVRLVRICVLAGDSVVSIIVTRAARWLLAEPGWSKRGFSVANSSRLLKHIGWLAKGYAEPETGDHNSHKHTLHVMRRIFELLLGLNVQNLKLSCSCQVNCLGMNHKIVQPEWSEIDWASWLEKQGPHNGGPSHFPADKSVRTIEADFTLPPVQFLLQRSSQSVLTVEIMPSQIGISPTPITPTPITLMNDGLCKERKFARRGITPLSVLFFQPHIMHPKMPLVYNKSYRVASEFEPVKKDQVQKKSLDELFSESTSV